MPACPNNHESATMDFCSVCGIEMNAPAPPPRARPAVAAVSTETCPICQTPRVADGGDYCEECGFNFRTRAAAPGLKPIPAQPVFEVMNGAAAEPEAPVIAPETEAAPVDPPTSATSAVITPADGKPSAWEAIVSVDPTMSAEDAANAPVGQPDRLYPLEGDKFIGRKSISRNFTPDIDAESDSAVSHQHAKLSVQSNGEIALVDLGSSNGTLLNNALIPPNVLHLLREGDVIGVGGWTKIVVRRSIKPE